MFNFPILLRNAMLEKVDLNLMLVAFRIFSASHLKAMSICLVLLICAQKNILTGNIKDYEIHLVYGKRLEWIDKKS